MSRRIQALLLTLLLATSFAGCLGDDAVDADAPGAEDQPSDVDPSVLSDDGEAVRDLRTELTVDDVVQAPRWTPGDLFGQHVFFGSEDTEGIHFDAVVHATDDRAFHLATDHEDAALQQALSGLPMLGRVDAADLSSDGFGGLWKLFEFPLQDGATWQGEIPNIAFDVIEEDSIDITFTATYADSIETLSGSFPGFLIEGHTANGTLIIETDYLPEIRWYNRLLVHDIDPGQDPVEFEVRSMGHERGWTGELLDVKADVLFATFDVIGFTGPPWEGGSAFVDADPYDSFTVGAGYDELLVVGLALAVAGAKHAMFVDPNGDRHEWNVQSAEFDDVVDASRERIEPVEGEWQWSTAGAGAVVLARGVVVGLNTDTIVVE